MDELNSIEYASPADKIRDLHRTLIHEHAHRAVAISYGVFGRVEVAPNPNGGFNEIHFTGRFTIYGRGPRSLKAIRLIGLSGALATMLLDDAEVDEWTATEELEFDESLSATDRELAGRYTVADVRAALKRIRRVWSDVVRSAELGVRAFIGLHAGTNTACQNSERSANGLTR